MTDARAKLYDAVLYWTSAGYKLPDDPEEANELVDAFAHELAEKIRDRIGRFDFPFESERTKEFVAFGRRMADLIDPEVGE